MKKLIVDIGLGLGIVVLVTIAQFFFHLPVAPDEHGQWPTVSEVSQALDREFYAVAVVAFLVSTGFALLLKVRGPREGIRHGLIWAAVMATNQLIVAITNMNAPVQTEGILFDRVSLWVLLAAVALGPIMVGLIKRPPVSSGDGSSVAPAGGTPQR